jgi:2-dehydropantoate 2-reductase
VIERVCVIGAGVIGSLFAGHLAQVVDVSVLTRRREHADALNRDGLTITGRSDLHADVTAAADPDALEPFDLGIVATKANGLEAAAAS